MDIQSYRKLRQNYNNLSDDYIIQNLQKRFKKPFSDITFEDLGATDPNANINTNQITNNTNINNNNVINNVINKNEDRLKAMTEYGGFGGVADPYNVNAPDPNALRFVAKGATFGFSDNLEALVRSQVGDKDYNKVLQEIREEMQQYAQENPESALAGEIMGGIVTPGGITKTAFKKINKLPSLAKWILKPLTISAQGGLYGYGTSDGQNTASNVAQGAITAPAFYGGLTAATKLGGVAIDKAKNLLGRTQGEKPLSSAEKQLGKIISDDVATPSSIMSAKQDSPSLTLAESIGINAEDKLRIIGKYPGKARKKIDEFLTKRNEKINDRVTNTTKKLFNIKGTYKDSYDNLILKQKGVSDNIYKKIEDIPIMYKDSDSLGNLLKNNPYMQRAYNKAYNDMRIDPDFDPKLLEGFFAVDANGLVRLISNRFNVKQADIIKKGIDSVLEKFRDKTTGRLMLKSEEAQNILKLRNRFLNLVDSKVPEYKAARNAWGGLEKQKEAMELGKSFMKGGPNKDPELFENRIENLTTDGKAAFILGATKQIELMLENSVNPQTIIRKLLKTPSYQKSLKMLFGDSKEGKRQLQTFVKFLKTEAKMGNTANKVLGGSPTAEIMTQMNFADDLIYIATGSQVAQMLGLAGRIGAFARQADEGFATFKPTAPNREAMADILLETNPVKIQEILDRAAKGRIILSDEDKAKLLARLAAQNRLFGGLSTVGSSEDRPRQIYDFTKDNLINSLRN